MPSPVLWSCEYAWFHWQKEDACIRSRPFYFIFSPNPSAFLTTRKFFQSICADQHKQKARRFQSFGTRVFHDLKRFESSVIKGLQNRERMERTIYELNNCFFFLSFSIEHRIYQSKCANRMLPLFIGEMHDAYVYYKTDSK